MKLFSKKALLLTILSIVLVAVMAIGGTIAFFTDKDEVTNTFTMGNVKIDLDEPNWEEDDGLNLLPGNVRTKDPTVTAVDGKSYMRIRLEIVDGAGALITDADRINLILSSLYYDTAYGTASPNISETQKYSTTDLATLVTQNKANKEYNKTAFAFAGIETGKPGVRYYNYVANSGIFDATATPADKAVLFTNVVIAKDWNNEEIYILNGDTYTTGSDGRHEVTVAGSGYKIKIVAEAIQQSGMASDAEAFTALDAATGVTRDTSGV